MYCETADSVVENRNCTFLNSESLEQPKRQLGPEDSILTETTVTSVTSETLITSVTSS